MTPFTFYAANSTVRIACSTSRPSMVGIAKKFRYVSSTGRDVIELNDGRLLLVYMEFSGTGSDFAKSRRLMQSANIRFAD